MCYNTRMTSFDKSARHSLFEIIGVLSRRRYQVAERCFAVLGLNHTEARLLTLLQGRGGSATQEALSNMVHIDRSNAGRALKRLEQDGYVRRRPDESNKRTNVVGMTAKGKATVSEIDSIRLTIANTFFGELTEGQAGEVVRLLQPALNGADLPGNEPIDEEPNS